jgi:hypothetical protein
MRQDARPQPKRIRIFAGIGLYPLNKDWDTCCYKRSDDDHLERNQTMVDSDSGSPFPWQSIAALVAVVGSLLLFVPPLTSSRPDQTDQFQSVRIGYMDTNARLWQDPFSAIDMTPEPPGRETDAKIDPSKWHQLPDLKTQIDETIQNNRHSEAGKPIWVLPVMVPGGPYPQDTEWRLRTRYALLSGFGSCGFSSRDGEHIGYFSLPWFHACQQGNVRSLPPWGSSEVTSIRIPYEWVDKLKLFAAPSDQAFAKGWAEHRRKALPDSVLILWLRREDFGDGPLTRLAELMAAVRSGRSARVLPFKLIGPPDSTTLATMVKESAAGMPASPGCEPWALLRTLLTGNPRSNRLRSSLQHFDIFSPWATAPKEALFELSGTPQAGYSSLTELFKDRLAVTFTPTIQDDDAVLMALAEELKTREQEFDLSTCDGAGRVAVVSEWDTTYGRVLPVVFNGKLNPMFATGSTKDPGSPRKLQTLWYSYLRGIDGELPGAKKTGPEKPPENRNDKEQYYARLLATEPPDGQAQFDYLRRLAQELILKNDKLRHDTGQGTGLVAVGVMGSDVYDKLLVLQALRKRLPEVRFFTTDLDARLFFPAEAKWSHNLIVASSFGLTLNPTLQGPIPPFRDCYQTALFYTTLRMLGAVPAPDKIEPPRIYEIGKKGPYDLSPLPTDMNDTIHPIPRYADEPAWGTIAIMTFLTFAMLAVFFQTPKDLLDGLSNCLYAVRKRVVLGTWPRMSLASTRVATLAGVTAGFSAVFALTAFVAYLDGRTGKGEPFEWFRGVSIWPSELLRIVAGFIGVYFLVLYACKLRAGMRRIRHTFRLAPPKAVAAPPLGGKPASRPDAQVLWDAMHAQQHIKPRLKRVIPVLVISFFLSYVVLRYFGMPYVPYRGKLSYFFDWGTRYTTIFLYLFVVFYTVDQIQVCSDFVKRLLTNVTVWPPQTIRDWRRQRPSFSVADLPEYLDITLIGQLTRIVTDLTYLPLIFAAVFVFSRMSYFADWDWPMSLVIVITTYVLIAIWAAITLRRSAERAREIALCRLRARQNVMPSTSIKDMIDAIAEIKEGAFAKWYSQPFIKGLLLPWASVGSVLLLDYLGKAK